MLGTRLLQLDNRKLHIEMHKVVIPYLNVEGEICQLFLISE